MEKKKQMIIFSLVLKQKGKKDSSLTVLKLGFRHTGAASQLLSMYMKYNS